jgi:hypothetical protein
MAERRLAGEQNAVRPSPADCCAKCHEAVADEWVSYRRDPGDPRMVRKHFGITVSMGPVEPAEERPKRTTREFHSPGDLDVFFHPWCAPRIELAEAVREEIAELLAHALIAEYQRNAERWARVAQPVAVEPDCPRCQVYIASADGRRIFTMKRAEWAVFRGHEGKIVEIDLHRTRPGGVEQVASVIAGLAAERLVHSERIEVWPYRANHRPEPHSVQDYVIIDDLAPRGVNLPKFAARAGSEDSPRLRKFLREHIFIVKERPDRERREPKERATERIIFMAYERRGR